jgi:amino acid transporter
MKPGWDLGTFFSYYTMVFACPVLYVGWKVVKRSKVVKPHEADLVWERPIIDAYEANTLEPHMTFWEECKILMGFRKSEEHVL